MADQDDPSAQLLDEVKIHTIKSLTESIETLDRSAVSYQDRSQQKIAEGDSTEGKRLQAKSLIKSARASVRKAELELLSENDPAEADSCYATALQLFERSRQLNPDDLQVLHESALVAYERYRVQNQRFQAALEMNPTKLLNASFRLEEMVSASKDAFQLLELGSHHQLDSDLRNLKGDLCLEVCQMHYAYADLLCGGAKKLSWRTLRNRSKTKVAEIGSAFEKTARYYDDLLQLSRKEKDTFRYGHILQGYHGVFNSFTAMVHLVHYVDHQTEFLNNIWHKISHFRKKHLLDSGDNLPTKLFNRINVFRYRAEAALFEMLFRYNFIEVNKYEKAVVRLVSTVPTPELLRSVHLNPDDFEARMEKALIHINFGRVVAAEIKDYEMHSLVWRHYNHAKNSVSPWQYNQRVKPTNRIRSNLLIADIHMLMSFLLTSRPLSFYSKEPKEPELSPGEIMLSPDLRGLTKRTAADEYRKASDLAVEVGDQVRRLEADVKLAMIAHELGELAIWEESINRSGAAAKEIVNKAVADGVFSGDYWAAVLIKWDC